MRSRTPYNKKPRHVFRRGPLRSVLILGLGLQRAQGSPPASMAVVMMHVVKPDEHVERRLSHSNPKSQISKAGGVT